MSSMNAALAKRPAFASSRCAAKLNASGGGSTGLAVIGVSPLAGEAALATPLDRSGVSKLADLGLMQYYACFGLRGGFGPCQTPYRLRPPPRRIAQIELWPNVPQPD